MEVVEQDLAIVEQADAYQADDLLIVRLAGKRPTACHIVSIERALTDVEPPAFAASMRIDPRARCMQQVADFEVAQAFRIGAARPEVLVHHAEGQITVEVGQLTVDGLAGAKSSGPLVPDLFGEPSEAHGYSRSFDLAEAVRDAIGKLPPRGAGIPDWLSNYSVVSIEAEIGGVAGFNHLRVTVRG